MRSMNVSRRAVGKLLSSVCPSEALALGLGCKDGMSNSMNVLENTNTGSHCTCKTSG